MDRQHDGLDRQRVDIAPSEEHTPRGGGGHDEVYGE